MDNLNDFLTETVVNNLDQTIDCSVSSENGEINVYFRDIEQKLLEHIEQADVIMGCVAWLTSEEILNALSKKENISLIVQKEDFLRPDINSGNNDKWKKKLRELYGKLQNSLTRYEIGGVLAQASYCGDPSIEPVRCVGNYNADKKPAFPRMHNKFIIFAKLTHDGEQNNHVEPYAIWTGSFNFTKNATFSLENALYISNRDIVKAFYNEYGQIAAISEPLDWEAEWIAPEWRIGS